MAFFSILAVLLLLSAFFSGSETALFSLSKVRVRRLQLEEARNSKVLASLLNKPRRLIISILIGNMLVNILASTTASSLSLDLFGEKGIGFSIVAMTVLILIFGEITPKVIAIRNSERIATWVAPYISVFSRAVRPLRWVLTFIVNLITPQFSRRIKEEKIHLTEEELKKAVELGRREGVLNPEEEKMIKSVFRFGDKTARDLMLPPNKITAVDISTPLSTIRSIIAKKELSRLPIFENKLDNIIGILYAKDLFIASRGGAFDLRNILRIPFYVDGGIKLDELLRTFRTHRIHMALIKGAGGKLKGLITLQDLLEEIVGQIKDIKG
jgi:CBS domain containing-hemolysin-like protein